MSKSCRRRKLPVTVAQRHGSSSTPRTSRTIIRKFHTLLKQQKSAQGDTLANINDELEKLGGLEKYQRMSCIGQGSDRGGGSEKVLIGWLKQMGWADQKHRQAGLVYWIHSRITLLFPLGYLTLAQSDTITMVPMHLGSMRRPSTCIHATRLSSNKTFCAWIRNCIVRPGIS